MKTRIVNKNALREEGDGQCRTDDDDYPIVIGQIGTGAYFPITSGSVFIMLEVYLFYKDFENAS
jgi:hypothetical protein